MSANFYLRLAARWLPIWLLIGLTLTMTPAAQASSVFTISSTVDGVDASPGDGVCAISAGECTLRAAVQEANALVGVDRLRLPAGDYRLTISGAAEDAAATGDLDVTDSLILQGAGADRTIVDAADLGDRVLHILSGVTATIGGVAIRNGRDVEDGAGVYNEGVLQLNQSRLAGNTTAFNGNGGGLANLGRLVLSNSTVSGNVARAGAGLYNRGTLTVYSSTVADNLGMAYSGDQAGAGLYNTGELSIYNSLIAENSATNIYGASLGGGLFNSGNVVIARSTLAANRAISSYDGFGGGVYNDGSLTVNNSTLSGNEARAIQGGFDSGGGIYNAGALTLNNSTLSNNKADSNGGLFNVGLANVNSSTIAGNDPIGLSHDSSQGGRVSLQNTIVAGNSSDLGGPDCRGTILSAGYNLIGDATDCSFATTTGDQVGTAANPLDPLLGPLQNNGGLTFTRALLPGSPVIDAGNPAGCADSQGHLFTVDQRGFTRPVDGDGDGSVVCDAGAFEAQ